MRNKAPLALMEQMVMLLVFALAAALCLQAFVQSDRLSRESAARDRAITLCQNAAELVRHRGGDLAAAAEKLGGACTGEELCAGYDKDWTVSDVQSCTYRLTVRLVDSGVEGLGRARISVVEEASENRLFELETAWQEDING